MSARVSCCVAGSWTKHDKYRHKYVHQESVYIEDGHVAESSES